MQYDVTLITVRPATQAKAVAILEDRQRNNADLLACWYSEIGALNRILLIHRAADPGATLKARQAALQSPNPFGLVEFVTGMAVDTFVPFDFLPEVKPGALGPCYEVRSYELKPDGLAPTLELWRKAVPGRITISPLLTAMTSVTGSVVRFMHIWPYRSLEERGRLRAKAIAEGVWPPPGGPDFLASQQTDIYLPAAWSPLR